MKKYKVVFEFSGYVRGEECHEVEAENEEIAVEFCDRKTQMYRDIIRDDTSRELVSAEEIDP